MGKFTPLGYDPKECDKCGEWEGASNALLDSVLRHADCFYALVKIQEIASSENPDVEEILELTLKTIGDKRE